MKPVIYETSLKIPHYLCDRFETITLPHLMSVLIEISGEQTAQVTETSVEELGLHWIIIQYDLQINSLPKSSDTIKVRTYAKEHNRLFSYREFEVYDEEGNLLIYVMTVFALIDNKRKLARLPEGVAKVYGSTENRRIKRMAKPVVPENLETATRTEYSVRYFDIDVNLHANNSMYYMWLLDALGDEFLATHDPIQGNVVFEKEVHIGEMVESYVDFMVDENDTLHSRHQLRVNDVVKSSATFMWKENDNTYNKPTNG